MNCLLQEASKKRYAEDNRADFNCSFW